MTRWEPDPAVASSVRDAFAQGGTVHTVSAMLGVTPPTLKKYAERLPWLGRAVEDGRAQRGLSHGTRARYRRGCRCEPCVGAKSEVARQGATRRRVLAARGEIPAAVPHGVASTYSNWGCRCEPCTTANTTKSTARRARRAAERVSAQQSAPDGA